MNNRLHALFYRLKEGVWLVGVEDLVAIHDCHQIFAIAQVDGTVRRTREHVYSQDVVANDFPFQHFSFSFVEVTLLNKAVSLHYNELFKLDIMPVLALGDAWIGGIDAHIFFHVVGD